MKNTEPRGEWVADEKPGYGRINGRLWRCTDPNIPDTLRQELVNGLMQARRQLAQIKRTGATDVYSQSAEIKRQVSPDDRSHGRSKGPSQGPSQGHSEGQSKSHFEGQSEGQSESQSESQSEGQSEGQSESQSQSHPKGHPPARRAVHAAKVALGERGPKWWLPMDNEDLLLRMRAAMIVLLSQRGSDKSLCPSEVARVVQGDDWRVLMPLVRDEAWRLVSSEYVLIVQRGEVVSPPAKGPVRIKQGPRFDNWWNEYLTQAP